MSFKQNHITAAICAALLTCSFSAQAEMVFRKGNGAEPQSLDPQIAEGVPSSNILRDLFEGLTSEDAAANVIPGLAESWDISEDGLTYTFHLRDALWSDGQAITAEDVIYAWQRAVDPAVGSNYSFILYPIKNAEAITKGEVAVTELGARALDDKTVEVTLEGPTPYFIGLLTHATAYPVPKHVIEQHGDQWTRKENLVSSGAFKISEWIPQSKIELNKSDTYWDKAVVKLDKVIYYPTEDENSELKRYRSGELDLTNTVPSSQLKWVKDNLADELKIVPTLGVEYYGFNLSKEPFKDNLKLREALNLAIDRKILTEKILGAEQIPAYSIVVPGINGYEGYKPEWSTLDDKARIEKARALYAEAGYSKDKPLKVKLLYNTSDGHKTNANAIRAMWKEVLGVDTETNNEEWKVFLNTRKQRNTEVFRAGWQGDYNDPNTFLDLFASSSELNDLSFENPEFDALLKKAGQELDAEKRAQILQQAEKLFTDSYAIIPLYFKSGVRLVKPNVKGFEANVMQHNPSKYISVE